MHFMNPVPVMKLVEVIRALQTSDEVYQLIDDLSKRIGKVPVEVNDSPGFVSNRVLMPMINEAVYCLMEGVATREGIDTVMKLGMNHPMGPLELADLFCRGARRKVRELFRALWRNDDARRYRAGVKVMDGVRIGRGAVVGAGADPTSPGGAMYRRLRSLSVPVWPVNPKLERIDDETRAAFAGHDLAVLMDVVPPGEDPDPAARPEERDLPHLEPDAAARGDLAWTPDGRDAILRARLFEQEEEKKHAERAAARRTQVGSGDRSERIRTYNYPQNRVTDHRINLTLYRLDEILEGSLDVIIEPLVNEHQAEQLTAVSE